MLKFYVFFAITVLQIGRSNSQCSISIQQPHYLIEGYYWREYKGANPSDALQGGTDLNGRPIYIGQTLFNNNLVVGKIYSWDNKMRHAWIVEVTATKNVKILCTRTPQYFKWVETTTSGMKLMTNRHFILGGYQPVDSLVLYVGRINHNLETSVGKVAIREDGVEDSRFALHFPSDGKEVFATKFEVLYYEPPGGANPYAASPYSASFGNATTAL